MKRILALMLVLLMLLSCLVACKGDDEGSDGMDNGETSTVIDDSEGTNYLKMLPEEDLGREFTLLCSDTKKDQYVTDDDIASGDVVSNAVFKRNSMVEEYKGVKIVFNAQNDRWAKDEIFYMTYIRNNVAAGDSPYDAVTVEQTYASAVVREGHFYDLLSIESLDLDAPWWHSSFVENNTVYGKLYMMAGDISHKVIGTAWTVFVNRRVAQNVGVDNFYDLVKNDEWTFENMMVCAKAVTTDNGEDSVYGLGLNRHALRFSCLSFAIPVCSRTDDGGYELTMYSDRTEKIYSSLYNAIYSDDTAVFADNTTDGQMTNIIPKFADDELLFMMMSLDFLQDLKQQEGEILYGILPYPKYDKNQSEYRTAIGNIGVYAALPVDVDDAEFSGKMLDALGAAGKTYVYPAYYENVMQSRTAQDTETVEMLNIIRDSMYFDFAVVHTSAMDSIYSKWGDPILPAPGGVAPQSFSYSWNSIKVNSGKKLEAVLASYKSLATGE